MVAFRPALWTRYFIMFSLDDAIHTAINIPADKPLFTTAFELLEKVEPPKIYVA